MRSYAALGERVLGSKIQSELIITSLLPALVSCRLGERAFTFQLSQLNGRYHVLWDWKLLGDEELHFPRGKSAGASAADEMGVSARRAALPR